MTVRVLGLVSGAGGVSMEDHRLLLQMFLSGVDTADVLQRTSGIIPSPGAADLTTASAMQADIAAFVAWIDGTSNALQGGYPFISDASETLTFSDGDATNDRIDLVVAQIRHDAYDGSGSTDARVVIVEGTAASSPSVPATPDSSIALFEVLVEAGTSAGSGGIDFGANATDVRTYRRPASQRIDTATRSSNSATAISEMTVDSLTAPLIEGRTYAVQWFGKVNSTVAGDDVVIRIREDSSSGSVLLALNKDIAVLNREPFTPLYVEYTAGASGDKTFVVTLERDAGSGDVFAPGNSSSRAYLYVDYLQD